MAVEERTQGRRPLTWLWMALALICVAGFLTWLGLTSEPSSVAIVEEDGDGAGGTEGVDYMVVPKDTLAANKPRFEGQVVQVPSLEATGSLGPAVFWGELGTTANQVPILVQMDSMLVASGMQVEAGSSYLVRGMVRRMTDSIATAWSETGVLPNEGARMQATFADYFIEARNIRPTQAAGGSEGGNAPADAQQQPQG